MRGVDSSHVPAGSKHSINWVKITKGDSRSLFVWPGAGNDLYIFKGLLIIIIIKKSDRDHMWPTKPKRFTIWPFTGKVCNLWGGGKGRALSCMGGSLGGGQEPCSCPLRRYPSPTSPDSWSLWRAPLPPQPRPGLSGASYLPHPGLVFLEGPISLALSMAPQSWSCQQTRVL